MSRSNIIVASRSDPQAILALSSFIHALYELESYAVARLVVKHGKSPVIVILAPSIEPQYECLIELELPFAEDLRSYRFPPLDRIVTVSGKLIAEHRNLPKDDLMTAMSDYVDHMDLSELGRDDDGYSYLT
jgi:ATP-dependent DNA helicase 2 subunit 2